MQMDEEDLQWIREEIAKISPAKDYESPLMNLRIQVIKSWERPGYDMIVMDEKTRQHRVFPLDIR